MHVFSRPRAGLLDTCHRALHVVPVLAYGGAALGLSVGHGSYVGNGVVGRNVGGSVPVTHTSSSWQFRTPKLFWQHSVGVAKR